MNWPGRFLCCILSTGICFFFSFELEAQEWPWRLSELEQELSSPDSKIREAAARELGKLHSEEALTLFKAALSDADLGVRVAAVKSLGIFEHKKMDLPPNENEASWPWYDLLFSWFREPHSELKKQACELLQHHPNVLALPHLVRALSDPDENVRLECTKAVAAISHLDATSALSALLTKLDDTSQGVKLEAIFALVKFGGGRAVSAIGAKLQEQNLEVKMAACRALAAIGTADAAWYLQHTLQDLHPEVVLAGLSALSHFKWAPFARYYEPLLRHDDPAVVAKAALALAEIGDRTSLTMLVREVKSPRMGPVGLGLNPIQKASEIIRQLYFLPKKNVGLRGAERYDRSLALAVLNLMKEEGNADGAEKLETYFRELPYLDDERYRDEDVQDILNATKYGVFKISHVLGILPRYPSEQAALFLLSHMSDTETKLATKAIDGLIFMFSKLDLKGGIRLGAPHLVDSVQPKLLALFPQDAGDAVNPYEKWDSQTSLTFRSLVKLLALSANERALPLLLSWLSSRTPLEQNKESVEADIAQALELLTNKLTQTKVGEEALKNISVDTRKLTSFLYSGRSSSGHYFSLVLGRLGKKEDARFLVDELKRNHGIDRAMAITALSMIFSRTEISSFKTDLEDIYVDAPAWERSALWELPGAELIFAQYGDQAAASTATNDIVEFNSETNLSLISRIRAPHPSVHEEKLFSLLQNANLMVSAESAWALGVRGTPKIYMLLKRWISEHKEASPPLLSNAIGAIRNLRFRHHLNDVLGDRWCSFLFSPSLPVRINALLAFAQNGEVCGDLDEPKKMYSALLSTRIEAYRFALASYLRHLKNQGNTAILKQCAVFYEGTPSGKICDQGALESFELKPVREPFELEKKGEKKGPLTFYLHPQDDLKKTSRQSHPSRPFLLTYPNGIIRVGLTDPRGAIFDSEVMAEDGEGDFQIGPSAF